MNKTLSNGKKAVIERARQLTDFEWTPIRDITAYITGIGKMKIPAWEPQKGVLWSSTEPNDKFIYENVSFETLSTIINNPDSALYCKDINGHNNSWPYFGIVCNGLVRYALNIQRRYSTKRWLTVPGMHKVFEASSYTVDQMEICDILYAHRKERSHVAIVTDIVYDENDKVEKVEVSEMERPTAVRKWYTPEDFYREYRFFGICRYDYIDSVPMPDADDCKYIEGRLNPQIPNIALDFGNKSNYHTYEEVIISVFREERNAIEIAYEGRLLETIYIDGRGKVSRKFEKGYYTARLISTGETLEFCVTQPQISHTVKDGKITICANANDSESSILYMDFREMTKSKKLTDAQQSTVGFYNTCCSPLAKIEELTEEEKRTGVFTREIPEDAYNFKVYFKNKYGVWTHQMIEIY